VSEISSRLRVTSPTVTQLVNDLASRGLVRRQPDPDDHRVIRVQLTQAGDEAFDAARSSVTDAFDGLIEYLGPEQSQQLADLLGQVMVYYNEHQDATAVGSSL
jgi:DNA-binding MarR family transcriptional regulator